ncbi:MAG: GatB/YqeY domain-containing protein [Gemmatimonadales bacterium]
MNGSLAEQLRAALNAARKDRDQHRTLLYSTILSDIGNRDIEVGHTLEDAEVVEVLRRGIKRRRESVEAFRAGGRGDAADAEQFEITELEKYLPPAVPEEEIRVAVRAAIAAGARDLGKLMGAVMPQFKGRAEGKDVNRIAREELAATS